MAALRGAPRTPCSSRSTSPARRRVNEASRCSSTTTRATGWSSAARSRIPRQARRRGNAGLLAERHGRFLCRPAARIQSPENLRGIYTTDADGTYEVRTIRPVPYPIPFDGPVGGMLRGNGRGWMRPGHTHMWCGPTASRTSSPMSSTRSPSTSPRTPSSVCGRAWSADSAPTMVGSSLQRSTSPSIIS